MPPKFTESNFSFEDGVQIPKHLEGQPTEKERDTSKLWLEGVASFSDECYPLAIDIDDLPTANILRIARQRKLKQDQKSSLGEGKDFGGIQDWARIRF